MNFNGIKNLVTTKSVETKTCETHGQYCAALIISQEGERWTNCPGCKDLREITQLADQKKDAEARKLAAVTSVMNRAAVPETFQNCRFDNYKLEDGAEQLKVFKNCKYFAENFATAKAKNIHGLLIGGTGTGKTHLSLAIVQQVLADGYSALFTTMTEIAYAIKSTFKKDSAKSEFEIINGFIDLDLLVIDECAVNSSAYEIEKLFFIVDTRYKSGRPTLILSNELKDLEDKIGSRVLSRLQESGFIQNCTWSDYRLKSKAA